MRDPADCVLNQTGTLFTAKGLLGRRVRSLYRVVGYDAVNDVTYVIAVDRNKFPSSSRMPRPVRRLAVIRGSGAPKLVEEPLVHPAMLLSEKELSEARKRHRDESWTVIEPLVEADMLALLDPKTRGPLIAARAEILGIRIDTIYRLVTRYMWFGCQKNALLDASELRGTRGKRLLGTRKQGRLNASERLKTVERGRSCNKNDLRRIRAALVHRAKVNGSYREAHEWMCATYYSGREELTPNQFMRRAKQLESENQHLERTRLGRNDYENRVAAARGNETDVCLGPQDWTDLDATGDDRFVVEAATQLNIGTGTLYLARMRGCNYIPGLFFDFRSECLDGYRQLLFIAFTTEGKRALFKLCGIDGDVEKLWPTPVLTRVLNSDRGPWKSNDARRFVTADLRKIHQICAVHDPEGKGGLEGMMRIVKRATSKYQGAYMAGKGRRNATDYKKALMAAIADKATALRDVLNEVFQLNKFSDVSHLLTAEMQADGVKPNPESMMLWARARIGGQSQIFAASLLFALLSREKKKVTRNGVTFGGAMYTSALLRKLWDARTEKRTSLYIECAHDKNDPSVLYWRTPEGHLDILLADSKALRRIQGQSRSEAAEVRLANVAEAQEQRRQKIRSRRQQISRSQQEALGRSLGVPVNRGRVSKGAKSLQQLKDRQAQGALSRQTLAPRPSTEYMPEEDELTRKTIPEDGLDYSGFLQQVVERTHG